MNWHGAPVLPSPSPLISSAELSVARTLTQTLTFTTNRPQTLTLQAHLINVVELSVTGNKLTGLPGGALPPKLEVLHALANSITDLRSLSASHPESLVRCSFFEGKLHSRSAVGIHDAAS
jgi:hypothetical protein